MSYVVFERRGFLTLVPKNEWTALRSPRSTMADRYRRCRCVSSDATRKVRPGQHSDLADGGRSFTTRHAVSTKRLQCVHFVRITAGRIYRQKRSPCTLFVTTTSAGGASDQMNGSVTDFLFLYTFLIGRWSANYAPTGEMSEKLARARIRVRTTRPQRSVRSVVLPEYVSFERDDSKRRDIVGNDRPTTVIRA